MEGIVKMSDIIDSKNNGMFDDVLNMIYSAKQKAEYQFNTIIIERNLMNCMILRKNQETLNSDESF